jgi:glycosyltransferase involved in cell wall biosynthesis
MKKIKVLEVIDRAFLGGGQINVLALASSLDKNRFEVMVCSEGKGALVDELEKRGIRHFPVPFAKKIRTSEVTSLVRILREQDISILHTHGGVAGFYGRWAARKSRTPVVVHTLHGIHYLHYRNPTIKRIYIILEKICSRWTDAAIFVCESDRERADRYGLVPPAKAAVIYNGVDFQDLEAQAAGAPGRADWEKKWGVDLSGPVIGTVARLHRQKGIPYLLEAARGLVNELPDLKVLVVGGGPLREKMEVFRRRLGLEGRVFFLGEQEMAVRLIALFDVFVLPSLWEGFPYSLMEAAALAKPVVATAVDGVKEMIRDGRTGILVSPKKPGEIGEAVLSLLGDRERARQLGIELKKDLRERFPLQRMVMETERLYLELLRKKESLIGP